MRSIDFAPAHRRRLGLQTSLGFRMKLEFTVGTKVGGKRQSVTVVAEDALMAALKVKYEKPDAVINYIRRANKRGDRRHPHRTIVGEVE
jgi:hypothetical protein